MTKKFKDLYDYVDSLEMEIEMYSFDSDLATGMDYITDDELVPEKRCYRIKDNVNYVKFGKN